MLEDPQSAQRNGSLHTAILFLSELYSYRVKTFYDTI